MCIELFFLFAFFSIAFAFVLISSKYYQKKITSDGIKTGYFEGNSTSTQKIRIGRAILSLLLFFLMCFYILPQLFEFHRVVITDDSTWKLKNMFGITIATIPSTEKRNVIYDSITVTFYNSYQKISSNIVTLVTTEKTYTSLGGEAQKIKPLYKELFVQAQKENNLENFQPSYNFTLLAYIRYGIIVVIVFVGWWFWRTPKTKNNASLSKS